MPDGNTIMHNFLAAETLPFLGLTSGFPTELHRNGIFKRSQTLCVIVLLRQFAGIGRYMRSLLSVCVISKGIHQLHYHIFQTSLLSTPPIPSTPSTPTSPSTCIPLRLHPSHRSSINSFVATTPTTTNNSPLPTQQPPQLAHPDPPRRQHRILQTIQVLAMDRRHELSTDETQEDARREVVFA
jgi:hypothetical protein